MLDWQEKFKRVLELRIMKDLSYNTEVFKLYPVSNGLLKDPEQSNDMTRVNI